MKLYVGQCPKCGHGAALEGDTTSRSTATTCTSCSTRLVLAAVEGVYTNDIPCDDRCMYAAGPACSCACGGCNHGRGYIQPVALRPVWVTERDAARAAAKADRKRARQEEGKAALVASHPALARLADHSEAYEGGFITDALEALQKGSMSDRFAEAAARAVEREEARAAARAERAAAEAAVREAGTVAPTGRVEVTGKVVSYRSEDGDLGRTTWKMLVRADAGWKVWLSIPSAIRSAACTEAFDAGKGYGLTMLVGRTVTFTAELTEGSKSKPDPLFRIGKRPTGGRLHPALVAA